MPFIRAASLSDLQEDEAFPVTLSGEQIALFVQGDEVFALHNVCTHQYALLSDGYLEDGCIECPLHQAQFDIRTGKAMTAPATVDVRTYPVKVENGEVFVDLG